MKNLLFERKLTLLALSIVMMVPLMTFAQDEVVVTPGLGTLQNAVTENPGKTLVLKRGGDYLIDATVEITVPTVIRCEDTYADSRPPVIQFIADPGQGGKRMIAVASDLTLEGIGFMGFTPDDQHTKEVVGITKPGVTLTMDGCILQGVQTCIKNDGQNNVEILQKNCIIYNHTTVGYDNSGGSGVYGGGDSLTYYAYNNTWVNAGRIIANYGGAGPNGTDVINHNTFVLTFGNPTYPIDNADIFIRNNIFYDSYIRGYVGEFKHPTADTVIWKGDSVDWKYDLLSGFISINPHKWDSIDGPNYRWVKVNNNLQMYSDHVLDFFAANQVIPQPFFPAHVYTFGEKYGWDLNNNFTQDTKTQIDPEFDMGAIPAEAYNNMFKQRQQRHLPASMQDEDYPYECAWRPEGAEQNEFIWPLPFSFKPTNEEIWYAGEDGFPLGDLNWFAPEVREAWENPPNPPGPYAVKQFTIYNSLKLENYPNPFRISTTIRYDVPAQSNVKVSVYNSIGERVAFLVNEIQTAGQHEMEWNANGRTHGLYFVKVEAGNYSQVRKIALME